MASLVVNNFHGADLIINMKNVQVRSQLMSKKTHNLIVRQNKKKDDYYFLMIDDFPTYHCLGYVAPQNVERIGQWTNFGHNSRPFVWSIGNQKLTPLEKFKYEWDMLDIKENIGHLKILLIKK